MRFILGFIFFGILFYAIWHFFPETFSTLVTWAGNIFQFFGDLIERIIAKFHKEEVPIQETAPAVLLFMIKHFLK